MYQSCCLIINFIETITKCLFSNFKRVQLGVLYLQSNLIANIEKESLVELKSLKHLYLYNNKLKHIRHNYVQDISFLYYLTKKTYCCFEINRFECDCKLVTYFQKFNYKRTSFGLCYNR